MTDLHVHTCFCDGADTPESIIISAIASGLDTIGFSGHSYTFFDESYCMSKENTIKYFDEIQALKLKYKDKITVLCGMELDYYSDFKPESFDYTIGSVHYIFCENEYIPIDGDVQSQDLAVKKYFDGDYMKLCEEYFKTAGDIAAKTDCDIIGHFDIVTKFIEKSPRFDIKNPRYIAAYQKAVDNLIPFGKPFEINTGAISRGYRTAPYPHTDIIDYIKAKGGKLILSSDAHKKENLCFKFSEYEKLL